MFTPKKLSLAILSACVLPAAAHASELAPIDVSTSVEESQQTMTDKQVFMESGNTETGTSLRKIPGVDASRMGGHGVDLNIRGQKESQLNVLIDGAKIEGGCPNRMDPPTSYAELSSIDEVTVVRGVKSVTYGTGGTGGTVLFERTAPTFENGKPYNAEINMGTTSNGLTQDLNATVSAGGDQGYIVLQGAKKSADNYEDGNGEEVNSSYETRQGHIDLGWTPNENHELRLSYENVRTEDALFQGAMMDAPYSDGTTTRLRYKGKNLADNVQALQVDIYESDVEHLMDNYTLRTPGMMKMENETDVTSRGAKIMATSQFGHTKLDYGLQYEGVDKLSDLRNAAGVTQWYMWPDVETETKSIFAESTSLFKDNQKVILGLRHDSYSAKANSADEASAQGIPSVVYNNIYQDFSGDTETDQTALNGLIRYERAYNNGLNVFAGLSRTHRFADATELYIVKGGSWTGNPDLDPEQHNQLDIGVSGGNKNTHWSVSAYYDRVHNYILRDLSANQSTTNGSGTVYLNKNAIISGIETSATMKATNNIDLAANLSFTKGTNETDSRNLSNIAPISGNISAIYSASNWDLGTRWNFADDQTEINEEYNELETAGWSTVDIFGNYQINKSFRLSAGIDNVFDKAYENYLNRIDNLGGTYKVYEPGQIIWARLNAKF